MSSGRASVWAESGVAQRVGQGDYSCEDIKFLWLGLYDRLMVLEGKVRSAAGWKDLRAILIDAYDMCRDGRWMESVEVYGSPIKGLIVHLSLITEAFGPDTELEGEALATLVRYELDQSPPAEQENLFDGVFG